MPKNSQIAAGFSKELPLDIPRVDVVSNQVASIGYDPETKTLAVTFTRGGGALYQYPHVEPETHTAFLNAESIGKFFGAHIQRLPFNKFPAPKATT